MMFSLERQKCRLTNLNLRRELHGEEKVLAADLTLLFDAANDVLSEFDPALKSSLYRKADTADHQTELPVGEPGHAPKLRFPKMGSIKWEALLVGAETTVHYGVDTDQSNVVLEDCRADGFKFDCKDGGTVGVKFRIACRPTPEQIATLSDLIDDTVEITLAPAVADDPQGSIS